MHHAVHLFVLRGDPHAQYGAAGLGGFQLKAEDSAHIALAQPPAQFPLGQARAFGRV